jgi:hypothetical protein
MIHSGTKTGFLLFLCGSWLFVSLSLSPSLQEKEKKPKEQGLSLEIIVLANEAPTDTGLDVRENQEIYFEASGKISLQKGNPLAECGPDGYHLQSVQQPFPDKDIGALVGEVVWLVSVEVDEKSGEETRHAITETFYIGAQNKVTMPLTGRLFLGINENLVGDNAGEFRVKVYVNKTESPY